MGKNVLIKIEYDGTDFSGWQIQPDARTVQGEIEHVLRYIAGEEVRIHGTSRTDAGVHALGQCASFEWNSNMPVEKLPEVMNRRFGAGGAGRSGAPGDIRILSAEVMPEDFHARYSCRGKTYRYVIDRTGDIFRRNRAFQFPGAADLDVERMREAAKYIVGTHDFKCFETAGGTPRESTVRTVSALDIWESEDGDSIIMEITGDGFLYNMVRIIAGTLVEAGSPAPEPAAAGDRDKGGRAESEDPAAEKAPGRAAPDSGTERRRRGMPRREPESVREAIESRDRGKAGFTAPPQGLYLKEIYF